MDGALILVAEDEPQIAEVLDAYLRRDGFRTALAADGYAALEIWRACSPDLMLLDIRMPRLDGLEVLSTVRRQAETPAIMVTALADEVDKLHGLKIGADDYVVKPVSPPEVVARVRAVLRRAARPDDRQRLRFADIVIDRAAQEVRVAGAALALTPAEYRLLSHMAARPRVVFSRSALLDACLPDSDAFDRVIDSHISSLRRKLIAAGAQDMVVAVRGAGYRLDPPA